MMLCNFDMKPNVVTTEQQIEIEYAVGQKWKNIDSGVEVWITDIDESLVTLDNKSGNLSSFDHMHKSLWHHLIREGVFKQV